MDQNRYRSPVVWAAVLAQLVSILLALGVLGDAMADAVRLVVAGVLEMLVLFGVLNNPTDGSAF